MLKRLSSAPPSLGVEREIKFALDARAAGRLRSDPLLADIAPTSRRQVSQYWDTEDRALRAAGLSLRLRHFDDRTVQTIKREADLAAGLLARVEDEIPLDGTTPDLDALARHVTPEFLAAIANRLNPVFDVDVERTQWRLQRDGSVLQFDLDEGVIHAGEQEQAVLELEIELAEGGAAPLFEVARELGRRIPLTLVFCTKSDRGYSLVGGAPCTQRRPQSVPLGPDATRADAFRVTAMAAVRAFAIHAATFSEQAEAETVHAMRVALRRLRTLIRFDADLFSAREARALRREIGWIFARLGAARDLDILMAETAAWPPSTLSDHALAQLRRARHVAYHAVAEALAAPRYRRGLLNFVALVECGAWAGRPAAAKPAREGADAALARQWRAVHDAGRPSKLSEKRRHKLRIHAKRLRYAADFYKTLYEGDRAAKRSAALLSATTALQDILGLMNDRAMMKALIAERLPSIARRHLPPPTGRSEAELLAEADEAYRRLRGRKPFWD